jgi:hypothetical protein
MESINKSYGPFTASEERTQSGSRLPWESMNTIQSNSCWKVMPFFKLNRTPGPEVGAWGVNPGWALSFQYQEAYN